MTNSLIPGIVSFVNHEKRYIIIEYEQNGRKKTVTGKTSELQEDKLEAKHKIKPHHFHIGDTVTFTLKIADRGDKMIATHIRFLYNTALDLLIEKARIENNFIGYLKSVDGQLFVKEIESYLFFPIPVSPWQVVPAENELNEAVTFSLENVEKKDKITAKLYNNNYIPEFYTAVKAFKSKTKIDAEVYKITPHGIYLNLVSEKIRSKLLPAKYSLADIKIGDKIKVIIIHIGVSRIIVEPVL